MALFKEFFSKKTNEKQLIKIQETTPEDLKNNLLPDYHPQGDFFIADIFDNTPLKDDLASMEHPIFTLSKKKDLRDLVYFHKNNENGRETTVKIRPNSSGLPTIFDKDILLYCGSVLMREINKGIIPPKTLRISPRDLLVTINREVDGDNYKRIKQGLERLAGTFITTNIKTNKIEQDAGFHLIEKYHFVKSSKVKNRMVKLEITLSDWFYNSLIGKEVITINKLYFRLGQPLERRLYEIARKYCGEQDQWKISMENLFKKSGSRSTLAKFTFNINRIIKRNILLDYNLSLEGDLITFKPKSTLTKAIELETSPKMISDRVLEDAKRLTREAGTGWDFQTLTEEFYNFTINNPPKDWESAFMGFVKKKIAKCP